MKTKLIIVLFLIIYSSVWANPKTIQSQLTDATVFFRGAELNHKASVYLNKGENEIIIDNLSADFDINTLKIKTSGNVLVSMYELINENTTSNQETIAKMQDSIKTYNQELEQIQSDLRVTENLLELLQEGIENNIESKDENRLGIDDLVKAMDYYSNKSKELKDNQLKYKRRDQEIRYEINFISSRISKQQSEATKTSTKLRLLLAAPQAGTCNLSFSYYTPLASWLPYYDINVESTDKPIKIISKAKVRQTTRVDWDKIKLTLSTSSPSNGKTAPLFNAWFLYNNIPARDVYYDMDEIVIQNAYSYKQSLSGASAIIEEPQQHTLDNYVNLSENELHQEYAIDIPYSVSGDGKDISINMTTQEMNAEYKYYCAPKLDTDVFLIAEIPNWQRLNLLSAKANITYDGTYVGESYINAQSTSEKLSLTLGSDKRVSVKREKMHDYSSTKTFGSDIKQVFTYKITVRNNQKKSIDLVLKDQYPLSTQKDIQVELITKETTTWTHNIEELGVITWEEKLKAGETKTYQISYSVKYPKDSHLNL